MSPARCLLAALAVALTAAPLTASPRDELLRYVPPDVGFCLVVQGLRDRLAEVQGSPMGKHVAAMLPALAGADEWKQLADAEAYLKKHLGVGWADMRDDLLGDAFAFAYRPGPADKPEQEQGLFLVRARDAKKLAALVDRLNALQKQTGELKSLDEREHRGVKYARRAEPKGASYYLLRGPVLLFTGQEAMLKAAIEHDKGLSAGERPPVAKRLDELKLDKALVALLLNPRAFDDAVARGAADAPGKALATWWKALHGVGAGLFVESDVRLSLTVQAKPEALPAPLRALFAAANRPSELWRAFPEDALFAAAGRVDVAALYEVLALFLTREARRQFEDELDRALGAALGKDVIKELLPALGPDWGVCVAAPPAGGKAWAPRLVAAVKVARGPSDDPVDEAVLGGVTAAAQLLVLTHNKKPSNRPIRLRSEMQGSVKVRYLDGEGALPPGLRPAFALKAGFLVVAGDPAQVRSFELGQAPAGDGVPLLRVSYKAWRAYLKERREPLAAALAKAHGLSAAEAARRLDALRGGLELIDRAELRQSASRGQVRFTLALTPSKPLARR